VTSPLPTDVMAFAATFLAAVDRCPDAQLRGGVVAACVSIVAQTAQALLYWCLERGPRWGATATASGGAAAASLAAPAPAAPRLFAGLGGARAVVPAGTAALSVLKTDADWVWALVVCVNDAALLTDSMEGVTGPRIASLSPEQVVDCERAVGSLKAVAFGIGGVLAEACASAAMVSHSRVSTQVDTAPILLSPVIVFSVCDGLAVLGRMAAW